MKTCEEASSSDDGLSVLTGILEEPTDVNCGPLLCKRLSELLHLRQAEDPAFANSTAVIEQTVRVEALNASQATQHVEGGIEEPQSVTFGELNALVDAAAARLQTQLSDLPFSRNLAKLTDCADLSGERRAQIERLQERSLVIVCMPTSLGRVVIQLACMKLHLAYTPVDHHFPQKQISRILHEFAPVACIVEEDSEDGGSFLSNQGTETVNLISSSALFTWEYVNQLRNASKCGVPQCCRALFATVTDPVILVLFTSGSTSPTPKGVALRNRQLMNRLAWQWSPASPLSGLTGPSLVKTSWLFVDAFTEVFGALLAGRPILLPISPRGHLSTVQMLTDASLLASLVHRFAVVQLTVVPEQLNSWLVQIEATADCDLIGHFSSLEVLVVSGQLLPVHLATDVFRIFAGGRIRLINLYGSTEVAGDVTVAVFESLEDVLGSRQTENSAEVDGAFFLPVGLPIQNCEVYVLTRRSEEDECGELHVLPRGETGEVYVSGAAVPTDGKIYADSIKPPQALSGKAVDASTLPNAFSSRSGFQMLFQTGDLGFVSPSNSQLYVCGRCDDTVKVNGVKCNLTAIDSFLTGVIDDVISNPKSQYRRFASLRATVTLLIESIQHDSSAGAEAESFSSLDLAKLIGGNLPSFVNVKVVQVAVFPIKSISGKIDKVKLKVDYHSGVYDHTALAVTKQQHSFVRESALTDTIGRERARAVFAKFLGLEAVNKNAVRPMDDEDFSQLGGDSMTAMLIVSELRYRGIPGNIMHFAGSGRIGTLLDQLVQPKEAGDICADLKTSGTFVLSGIHQALTVFQTTTSSTVSVREIVVQMLASSFHQLEPISRCLHFSEEALSLHVEAQLRPDCPNRAVVLLAGFLPSQPDAAGSLNPHSLLPHVRMSMLLLQPSHESPTEEAKRPTGMEEDEHLPPGLFEFFDDLSVQIHITIDRMLTINCHMLGLRTDEVLGTDAKIRLGTLLEKEAMKTAQRMGYKFIDTVNTNQLTQAICENLGYELMNQADFVAYAQDRGLICDPSVGEINCKYMVKRLSPAEDMNA